MSTKTWYQEALEERIAEKLEYSSDEEIARWKDENYGCLNGDHNWGPYYELYSSDSYFITFLSECLDCDFHRTKEYIIDEEKEDKDCWEFPDDYFEASEETHDLDEICHIMNWDEDYVRKVPTKEEVIDYINSDAYQEPLYCAHGWLDAINCEFRCELDVDENGNEFYVNTDAQQIAELRAECINLITVKTYRDKIVAHNDDIIEVSEDDIKLSNKIKQQTATKV